MFSFLFKDFDVRAVSFNAQSRGSASVDRILHEVEGFTCIGEWSRVFSLKLLCISSVQVWAGFFISRGKR